MRKNVRLYPRKTIYKAKNSKYVKPDGNHDKELGQRKTDFDTTKVAEIVQYITEAFIDIVVITETKKKRHESQNFGDYILFYSAFSKNKRMKAGNTIAIKKYREKEKS